MIGKCYIYISILFSVLETGDHLLLHYIGDRIESNISNDYGYIGWSVSYSSFYGFKNEMYQSIITEENVNNVDVMQNKVDDVLLNINSNLLQIDKDEIKYKHLKLQGIDNCVWKLCQLDDYQNLNHNDSNITCYNAENNPIESNIDDNNDHLISEAVKVEIHGFVEIIHDFMKAIDLNGIYYLSNHGEEKTNVFQSTENLNNLSMDSTEFPKIEITNDCTKQGEKPRNHRSCSKSHISAQSLSSLIRQPTNSFQRKKHHHLAKRKKILTFGHETHSELKLIVLNNNVKSCKFEQKVDHWHSIVPRAAIFHDGLQQFVAYIPFINRIEEEDRKDEDMDYDDNILNILDGSNWRIIQWNWKTINNLSISTQTAWYSYYLAQLLSIWIFIIGIYQWYVDIEAFVKYLNDYGDKYSVWRQYECYAFIVTNTPNMKQLVLISGLIIWSQRVNNKSNYQIYLQKQTPLQIILLMGYFLLIIFFIPVIFTHFLLMFIPIFILMWSITLIALSCKTKLQNQTVSVHDLKKKMKTKHKEMIQQVHQVNDVTNSYVTRYGCHFRVIVASLLWKFACLYFVVILCVPVLSRVYDGINIWNAFLSTYNERHTIIYFENLRMGYNIDLDRLRLLLYWLL